MTRSHAQNMVNVSFVSLKFNLNYEWWEGSIDRVWYWAVMLAHYGNIELINRKREGVK